MNTTQSDLEAHLARIARRYEELQRERLAEYGDAIRQAPRATCPQHPAQGLELDLEASTFQSARARKPVAVHRPCPLCQAQAEQAAEVRKLLARGFPERSAHMTLDTWDPAWEPTFAKERAAALESVRAWCTTRPNPFLVIMGRAGAGKTALGVAACRAIPGVMRALDCRTWLNELLALEARPRQSRIDLAKAYTVLMLDDFGARSVGQRDAQGANPFERDTIGELIAHRYDKRLATIITSNLDGKAFAHRLDDATVSRIRGGRLLIDASKWPSRREANE